jgi:hypothetical protein
MIIYSGAYRDDSATSKPRDIGGLSDDVLAAFAVLIDRRRSLPVFLGDMWRCCACGFEHRDVATMTDHILNTHDPEPFNQEDMAELLPTDRTLA